MIPAEKRVRAHPRVRRAIPHIARAKRGYSPNARFVQKGSILFAHQGRPSASLPNRCQNCHKSEFGDNSATISGRKLVPEYNRMVISPGAILGESGAEPENRLKPARKCPQTQVCDKIRADSPTKATHRGGFRHLGCWRAKGDAPLLHVSGIWGVSPSP